MKNSLLNELLECSENVWYYTNHEGKRCKSFKATRKCGERTISFIKRSGHFVSQSYGLSMGDYEETVSYQTWLKHKSMM